jgi:hypothetical protein
MKNVRDVLGLRHKKSLRLGLLFLSSLCIISASALVYARMIYERALYVGNTSGVTGGSGLAVSAEVGFTVAALVVGLGMFGVLREASRRISSGPGGRELSPTGPSPVSMSPGVPGVGLPLHPPSTQGEEWEESPAKDDGEE